MASEKTPAVREGEDVLAGSATSPAALLELVGALKAQRCFGLARKLLDRYATDASFVADPKLRLQLAQQRSLCTYKDPDLLPDLKLDQALTILRAADDLASTRDQETLGQAGAIYKRKWELTASEKELETSLAYYLRGYDAGVAGDDGYTAINAAFVLDLLADTPHDDSAGPRGLAAAAARREQAAKIRSDVVATLTELRGTERWEGLRTKWWFLVTLGEAYFGLGNYEAAKEWLTIAHDLQSVADWERETTARQLATLLRLKRRAREQAGLPPEPAAREVLEGFLGADLDAVDSVIRGKVGLALSGGGFRASLFHIGVLARLAELDILRHVECLSCVSGGSIIGAHYYLEMQRLLETKFDKLGAGVDPKDVITQQDYLDIVERVTNQFFAGVETNIRTRIAAEWSTNLKMIFSGDYSRTKRAGELYEQYLFARVADGKGDKERWMTDLCVTPPDEPNFSPKDHNWRRANKVPILVLNATALNTGHNWQFTATWMGEPPAGIESEIDANYRLRRLYYRDAPESCDKVRLGYAVAASACVPGIFEPLPIRNLYERESGTIKPVVRLVDGGVHDNQGIASLIEQGCSVLLVSDASGQMDAQDFPSSGVLGVSVRANNVLQARVREAQFRELEARRRTGLLQGLMFIHLKKNLPSLPVDWIDCQDPSTPATLLPRLPYGIQSSVQRRLAAIRTDLDSFSEAEAYALMTSGYRMTEHALQAPILGFAVPQAGAPPVTRDWAFLPIEPLLKQPGENTPLMRQLAVADKLFFKIWLLLRPLQIAAGGFVMLALALLAFAAFRYSTYQVLSLTVRDVALALLFLVVSAAGLGWLLKIINYRKTIQEILIGVGMTFVGAALARLHLHVFDRWFLSHGRLARLLSKAAGKSASQGGGSRSATDQGRRAARAAML